MVILFLKRQKIGAPCPWAVLLGMCVSGCGVNCACVWGKSSEDLMNKEPVNFNKMNVPHKIFCS